MFSLTFHVSRRYNLLNYLKAEFVLNASLINPFKSSHFFWIDGGYGHGLPNIWPPHKGKRWPDPEKVCRYICERFVSSVSAPNTLA
jgi:hypothetical protein